MPCALTVSQHVRFVVLELESRLHETLWTVTSWHFLIRPTSVTRTSQTRIKWLNSFRRHEVEWSNDVNNSGTLMSLDLQYSFLRNPHMMFWYVWRSVWMTFLMIIGLWSSSSKIWMFSTYLHVFLTCVLMMECIILSLLEVWTIFWSLSLLKLWNPRQQSKGYF